eukprot:CAMPEP_0177676010 /NCGR_PEP_ID=MMETSP0447-20121125/27535_1 /TAXON_ID=0 /ORGANISM="Stygamoeba regulata, Strain BSH-02190019" /LENGTH=107 /DNA_ID=CAMNT_0019184493 /DNA_START=42 /DNA_END=365 /DNA_ORIENTATION=+
MSAPTKCPRCGKTVYFAERQEYKGKEYHPICAGLQRKEDDAATGPPLFSLSERIHCNPEDPKVHDERYHGSAGPHTGHVTPSKPNACACGAALAPNAKFCCECGAKV